jgi:hypothetical protein
MVDSSRFGDWAAKSVSFTQLLSGIVPIIQISHDKMEAYVVHPDHKSPAIISIPIWYFEPKFYAERGYDEATIPYVAVSMLNGTLNHESLHLARSLPDLEQIYKTRTDRREVPQSQLPVLYRIINCVEDIHIESWFKHTGALEYNFIQAKNAILFTEKDFADFSEPQDITKLLGRLAFWKNEFLRDLDWSDIDERIVNELKFAQTPNLTHTERADAAMRIFEVLASQNSTEDMDEAADQVDGSSSMWERKGSFKAQATLSPDSQSGGSDDDGDGEESQLVKAIKAAIDAIQDDKRRGSKGDDSESAEDAAQMFLLVSNVEVTEYHNSNQEIEVQDAMELKWPTNNLTPEQAYATLGVVLAQIRTIGQKPASIVTQERGARIVPTKIGRIAVDGKIFGNRDTTSLGQSREKEVIILGDFSGSTAGTYLYDRSESMFEMIVRVQWAAFKALKAARIPVRIYGHTSTYNNPWILHIASEGPHFKDAKNVIGSDDERFPRCLSVNNGVNYDGVALYYAAKQFSQRNSKKIIIIISDGQPSGAPSGFDPMTHTMQTLADLTRQHITVISVSLTREAMEANNKIYGKNNVDATNPTKFVNSFRQLVQQLVQN